MKRNDQGVEISTYRAIIFCPESVVCFLPLAENIQVHFRLDFIMEANTMNPDQTAPQGSHQSKTSYKYMIWHSDEKLF